MARECATPGCGKVVEKPLACPTCVKIGLPPTYFCGQTCFKSNWKNHKGIHKIARQLIDAQGGDDAHRKAPPDGVTCEPDAPPEVRLGLPTWAKSYTFTGPTLRPALVSPKRILPSHIRRPDYADHVAGASMTEQRDRATNNAIRVYGSDELDGDYGLRHACAMGREVLDIAGNALRVGVTTDEIDRIVHEACIERDVYPSPLNYYNFPKSVCTSVNEVICHGIPDYREIEDGDIVNIDVTVFTKGGYHGDLNGTFVEITYHFLHCSCKRWAVPPILVLDKSIAGAWLAYLVHELGRFVSFLTCRSFLSFLFCFCSAETFCVGKVDEDGQLLVKTSFDCLANALAMVKPGTLYRDLGSTIHRTAVKSGCAVNRTYCGHGIGSLFHTAPNVPHYHKNKAKGIMKPGHVFTVEPMINLGTFQDKTWGDNWTAVTADGKRSAQFEHTVLVTATGCEILTARDSEPVMEWKQELNHR